MALFRETGIAESRICRGVGARGRVRRLGTLVGAWQPGRLSGRAITLTYAG